MMDMRCLALETSTDIASIALADENGLIGEYDFAHRMDLSRRLMPNIVTLLADNGMEVRDVEAIGVSLGPGSFTGLRIGVTTAKTLAQVLEIPIVGVVSLDVLARQFDFMPDRLICSMIRVRKGEVYFALYRVNAGAVERISEYEAGTIERVAEKVSNIHTPIVFCGDGVAENMKALRSHLGDHLIETPARFSYPKGSIIAAMAMQRIEEGKTDDPLSVVPFYIRRSAPEMRELSSEGQ